jgi:hypothetical protein
MKAGKLDDENGAPPLCQVLADSSPDALALVRSAFDRAADNAELAAITFRKTANPNRLVEEMRRAVLRHNA